MILKLEILLLAINNQKFFRMAALIARQKEGQSLENLLKRQTEVFQAKTKKARQAIPKVEIAPIKLPEIKVKISTNKLKNKNTIFSPRALKRKLWVKTFQQWKTSKVEFKNFCLEEFRNTVKVEQIIWKSENQQLRSINIIFSIAQGEKIFQTLFVNFMILILAGSMAGT